MASTQTKMICPICKAEMNHHCDKLIYPADPHDEANVDSSLGGLVEEFHTCPKCGGTASRQA